MSAKKRLWYLVVSLLCFLPVTGAAKEKVEWMEAVAPPFFIHEGELAGQGYEDVITDIITENLPQYEHQRVVANITRHYKEFKDGKNACNVGLFKTAEREQFLYYSIPSFFTLPAVVIINKKNYPDFGSEKSVKLEDVLKSGQKIGRSLNRSYGKDVDRVLDTFGTPENVFKYEGSELSLNLFKMLKHGRLDGLIGLPEEAMYQAERLGIRDQIMTLSITENQGSQEAWLSYVACSKNEWGKQVIEEINEILLKQRPTERYRQAYERWLDDSTLEGYRKQYDRVFLKAVE